MSKCLKVKIEIELCLLSPMHIGSSEEFILATDSVNNKKEHNNINLLARNADGYPYIPAASIKGSLRSLYNQHFDQNEGLYFGQAFASNNQQGALAVFNSAMLKTEEDASHYFVEKTQVAIDPITKTGIDNQLFTKQWVKPGITFNSEITFEHIDTDDLDLFLNFIKQVEIQLGAGASIGSGKMKINLLSCSTFQQHQLQEWLNSSKDINSYYLPYEEEEKALASNNQIVKLNINLLPQAPFISNSKQETQKHEKNAKHGDRTFDQYTIIDHLGKPYIPASSIKGVLRHYLTKVANTISTEPCEALLDTIFGNTGAKGYTVISDALSSQNIELCKHEQTMVAIDRFTGGVEQGALLDIQACYPESFIFDLSITKNKVTSTDVLLWCFALRDLMAGKLYFGAHSASGFGKVTATIKIGGRSFNNFSKLLPELLSALSITQDDLQTAENKLQGVCHD